MTTNVNLLRSGILLGLGSLLWFFIVFWEKAIGWPILSVAGLLMAAIFIQPTVVKLAVVAVGGLILAGLWLLPLSGLILLTMIGWWWSSRGQQRFAIIALSWLAAMIINLWQKPVGDPIVTVYLLTLVIISLVVLIRVKNRVSVV